MNQLFDNPHDRFDPEWIIRSYMDWIYDSGYFVEMVSNVVKRCSFTTDDVACRFPDKDSYFEEDHFEGVEVIVALGAPDPDEIIVPESVFWTYLRMACKKYLDKHPGDRMVIATSLDSLSA